jgi:predicted transcriptional regulator
MRKLSKIEKETYDFIKEIGEIQTTNLPNKRMWGTIPNLENLGLVEVFKKYTSYFRSRKKKFVKFKSEIQS